MKVFFSRLVDYSGSYLLDGIPRSLAVACSLTPVLNTEMCRTGLETVSDMMAADLQVHSCRRDSTVEGGFVWLVGGSVFDKAGWDGLVEIPNPKVK